MSERKNRRNHPVGSALERRRREGSVAITVTLLLSLIFGMVALAVDASQLYKVRTEGQNAADAATLAAASELDGTSAGITAARAMAVGFADENRMYSGGAVVDGSDVTFGRWSPATGVFTALAETEVVQINAVRVALTRAIVNNPFAMLIGNPQTDVGAFAIAAAGGPAALCSFPMVVGDCDAGIGEVSGDRCFRMQGNTGSNDDTAGWSNLGAGGGLGGPNLAALMRAGCLNLIPGCSGYDATATECAGACNAPAVDESISSNNGTNFTEGGARYGATCPTAGSGQDLKNHCQVIKQLLLRQTNPDASEDPADLVTVDIGGVATSVLRGTYFEVKVPMIPGEIVVVDGKDVCSPDFDASGKPVTGYATIDIYGVKCATPNLAVIDDAYLAANADDIADLECEPPPSDDFVLGRMRLEPVAGPGGGGNPGESTVIPRLVQ